MECNKDEALRAMKLAEKKMAENDFVSAQKFAKKAQQLYPETDNISRILTVCEVHCSSMVKVGTEMDWYRILQIDQSADVGVIKRQFRKLAFLLHPDKNVFAGAEAAFKLIGEANRTLSDETKRSLYDRKYRDLSRVGLQNQPQSGGGTKRPSTSMSAAFVQGHNLPKFSGQPQTFWTRCVYCNVRYEYHFLCYRATLVCQGCNKYFVAENIGTPEVPVGAFRNVPHPNASRDNLPQKVPGPEKKKGASSRKRSSSASKDPKPAPPAAEEKKMETNVAKSSEDSKKIETPKPEKPEASKNSEGKRPRNVAKSSEDSKKIETPKPEKPEASKNSEGKRPRKLVVESSESDRDVVGAEGKGNDLSSSKLNESKRSSLRQKQNVSYKEKLNDSDDDDFVNPPKRSKVTNSASLEIKGERSKGKFSDEETEESKQNTTSSTGDDSEPEVFQVPDPEFNDFDKDKAESCFAANQVWAMYDPEDGMPRFYARIKTVSLPRLELKITWLEARPDREAEVEWCSKELPVGCGKFKLRGSDVAGRNMFSHQISFVKGLKNTYLVLPRKGETWALFQNWDMNWSSEPKKYKPYEFDFVEIVKDFDQVAGGGVAFLGRVEGFVSLFQRCQKNGVLLTHIPPYQRFRFSHRIPSFRMTGKERKGVPEGSFEFDPAALPQSFFEPRDSHDSEAIPEPSNHESESPNTNGCTGGSKKENGNFTPSKRSNVLPPTDENANTPKKPENCVEPKAFELRRSPRDLSKRNTEANGSHLAKEESPGRKPLSQTFDFSQLTSEDKFKRGQIWALSVNGDPFPKSYGHVKKIERIPKFQVFLALLEPKENQGKQPVSVSCGTFKTGHGKAKPFPISSFSHCLNASPVYKKEYSILPLKGEIWALYKNQNQNESECDVIEVLEDEGPSTKVVVLSRVAGFESVFRAPARAQRSTSDGVVEVPQEELCRFSHQIRAFRHNGESGGSLDGCWELDPKFTPGRVIYID